MDYYFPNVNPKSLLGMAYTIIDELNGGKTVDDNAYSPRLIMSVIASEYAKVLEEDLRNKEANGEPIGEDVYTHYDCVKLEDVKGCGCGGSICGLKRVKLPNLAKYAGNELIKEVSFPNGEPLANATSFAHAKSLASGGLYQSAKSSAYRSNGYLYVLLTPRQRMVCEVSYMAVVTPNEEAVTSISENGLLSCESWESAYPMLDYLESTVRARVRAGDGNALLTTTPKKDIVNNGNSKNV